MPTKIEWTDETWNPIRARNRESGRAGHFCVHVSPACEHCYAEGMQARLFGNPVRYAAQDAEKVEIFLHENALMQPLRWRRPRRIFVCSMTDLFYEGHSDDLIAQVFAVMAAAPQHTFQVLTKRPLRMLGFSDYAYAWQSIVAEWAGKLCEDGDRVHDSVLTGPWPLPNVWLGVSIEDQRRAEERIPHLLDTPAAVRFLSAEPLLGPIDLTRLELVPDSLDEDGELRRAGIRVDALRNKHCESGVQRGLGPLDQVIVGGESGPKARPMHPQWARDLRDQCQVAGVAYFLKQWGEWAPYQAVGGTGWSTRQEFYRDGRPKGPWKGAIHDGGRSPDGHLFDGQPFQSKMLDDGQIVMRLGKKRAGRLLDGREWNEVPA